MLSLKNISKKYDDTTILEDISFTCEKGDIVGLIGSSGSGKTTLIQKILDKLIYLHNQFYNEPQLQADPH